MDLFPITAPDRPDTRPAMGHVRADGSLVLPPRELQRAGVRAGDDVEIAADAEGIRLLPTDPRPRKLYLELTTACNLDCAMCIRRSQQDAGGDMTARTLERLLGQLADLPSLATVNLSGFGEAMTHPRFFAFAKRIKAAGLRLELVTNGTLLDRRACVELIGLKADRLIASIDGLGDPATRLLHPEGSFQRVRANLSCLRREKRMRHLTLPEVTVVFVATRTNMGALPALKRLAPELGFSEILVTNVVPHTPELADQILYEHWTTSPRRRGPSFLSPRIDLPLMDAQSANDIPLPALQRSGALLSLNGRELAGDGPRCRFVTEGRFAIRWDGAVAPCLPLMHTHACYFRGEKKHVRRFSLGNVNETSLRAIWESEDYRRFRQHVREFDFAPCFDCAGCELRETNERDCVGDEFPRCGECLWAHGLVQCP